MCLDARVVAWLYGGAVDPLPQPVRDLVDGEELVISRWWSSNCGNLFGFGRAKRPGRVVVEALVREIGLGRCGLGSAEVVAVALGQE
jgi:hypothetical protein